MAKRFQQSVLRKVLVSICRVFLALVFIYAALGKISNPAEFADAVAAFKILPITSVNIFAIILPWVELLIGLALLSGSYSRNAALLTIVLNCVFIIAVLSAMARGLDIECGCFTLSKAHSSVGWLLIVRDIIFILTALPLLSPNTAETSAPRANDPSNKRAALDMPSDASLPELVLHSSNGRRDI